MKHQIAILYSDSRFTPWNENIDVKTVKTIFENIPKEYHATIVHMTEPNNDLAELLKTFKFILNLCYGFQSHSQAEIALWLDKNNIPHLSTSGEIQSLVQDKLLTEALLLELKLPSVGSFTSLDSILKSSFENFIIKPRTGGCHRGILTLEKSELFHIFDSLDLENQLIQPYLIGREFSVAIIPSQDGSDYLALNPIEIKPFPKRTIFIAGQQYGVTEKDFNPELDENELEKLKTIAVSTHKLLNLRYYSRIDFRLHSGNFYILDVNSMPNLHPDYSMLPAILGSMGIHLSEFIERIFGVFESKYSTNLSLGSHQN